jgi:hypothetical protein
VSPARRGVAIFLSVGFLLAGPAFVPQVRATSPGESPIPVLAYYYIWYDETSWDRAKTDYPVLGRYSSDDPDVMRQQVQWAKQAGIDGFIVSWKSTLVLDKRLEQLMKIADEESFKLAIMYQGLDFNRNPQPIERVAADLDYFIENYAGDPAFDVFGGPLIVWSGTWEFTPEQINSVAETRRRTSCQWRSDFQPRCVTILATERNVDGVNRLAGIVDGDAYYWSSVNPATFPGYQEKLNAMRDAVKQQDGFWIAPAAPGFDARLVGGSTVVERNDGQTLRTELDAAYGSSPDAIGLISWNEFSENTQVEPSQRYGTTALEVLADVANGRAPVIPDMDSSEPDPGVSSRPQDDALSRILALGLIVGLLVGGGFIISRRQRRPVPLAAGRLAPWDVANRRGRK